VIRSCDHSRTLFCFAIEDGSFPFLIPFLMHSKESVQLAHFLLSASNLRNVIRALIPTLIDRVLILVNQALTCSSVRPLVKIGIRPPPFVPLCHKRYVTPHRGELLFVFIVEITLNRCSFFLFQSGADSPSRAGIEYKTRR